MNNMHGVFHNTTLLHIVVSNQCYYKRKPKITLFLLDSSFISSKLFFLEVRYRIIYIYVVSLYLSADCSKVTCAYGATCKVINDGAQLQCECDFTCDSKNLVCGSDLKTYDNDNTVLGRDKCG